MGGLFFIPRLYPCVSCLGHAEVDLFPCAALFVFVFGVNVGFRQLGDIGLFYDGGPFVQPFVVQLVRQLAQLQGLVGFQVPCGVPGE